jgi:hypothetical protein
MEYTFKECYIKGTVFAIDGIVIQTNQPRVDEVGGDIVGNFNRKGYFGMVAISAVDAWARFIYSELNWSGSTNDCIAYKCTSLNTTLVNGGLPDDLHGVADEAFSSSSPQILTPFSRRSLRMNKASNPKDYEIKRT